MRPPAQIGHEWRQWWPAGTALGRQAWEQALQQAGHTRGQRPVEWVPPFAWSAAVTVEHQQHAQCCFSLHHLLLLLEMSCIL